MSQLGRMAYRLWSKPSVYRERSSSSHRSINRVMLLSEMLFLSYRHTFHRGVFNPLPNSSILKLNPPLPLVSSLHLPTGLLGLFFLFSASISS